MEFEKKNRFVEEEINTILKGINSYNYGKVVRDYKPFVVVAKDDGQIIGGAQCASAWHWMNVKLLWVKKDQRHKGTGT